jgi:type I restriction enzyme S subunit
MSLLPKGWCRAPLEQIACIKLGKMLDKAKNKGELYPYLRNVNVRWGDIELSDLLEMPFLPDELDTYCIQDGDLFLCEGGEPGRSAVWRRGQTSVKFQKAIHRVRFEEGMTPEFFAAELRYAAAVGSLDELLIGTTIKHLTRQVLAARNFPVPPSKEQRRIVSKLDALDASAKRARADLDRIPTLVARAKQAILEQAFRGELTSGWRQRNLDSAPISPRSGDEIRKKYSESASNFSQPFSCPSKWRWLRLPELGDLDRGKSRHRPRNDPRLFGDKYPFIQTGEIRSADRFILSASNFYGDFGIAQSRLWPEGTVCITIAANIAETAILSIAAAFPDSVVGFIADSDRAVPDYIEFFLRTMRADLELFAPSTAQKNINLETLANVVVPTPPLAEQAEIVRRIEAAFAKIDRIAAEAAAARALLDRLDQAILAKAFRGELVPRDPSDEPAEKLLEQIKAARAARPARKTRKKQS